MYAPPDHFAHAFGDAEPGRVSLVPPTPVLDPERADFPEMAENLDEEEWAAIRLPASRVGEKHSGLVQLVTGGQRDEIDRIGVAQTPQYKAVNG
jgi:hypothetical protein